MVGALFDTNILIDFLNGVHEAREELGRYEDRAISVVSWIEVMIGADASTESATRGFLDRFDRVELDNAVAERAVDLRRKHGVKLPDAVIWASALCQSMLLITRNVRDFPANDPGVRVPYSLS